jgi:hypothetical protein
MTNLYRLGRKLQALIKALAFNTSALNTTIKNN